VLAGPASDFRSCSCFSRKPPSVTPLHPARNQSARSRFFSSPAYTIAPGHKVPAACFHPRPDIESYLLNLVRRPAPFVFSTATKALVRACFQQRRKQIGSLLRERLPDGGASWLELLRAPASQPKAGPRIFRPRCGSGSRRLLQLWLEKPAGARYFFFTHAPFRRLCRFRFSDHHRLRPGRTARRRFSAVSKAANYVSPTGAFKVAIPSCPNSAARSPTPRTFVTFQDDFNVHISIAAFSQDATQRWKQSTRG